MRPFKKITIVGVGLLGGSVGLAVRKHKLADKVTGFFRDKGKIAAAVKMGAVDEGTDDLKKAVALSGLIILCSPVSDIIKKLKILKKIAGKTTIITDTGSTKSKIVKAATPLNFIGSHPLTGSEQSGVSHARADLFKNSILILTPQHCKQSKSLTRLAEFWEKLGSKTIVMTPEKHDHILAFSSHLPHATAFSLMQALPKETIGFAAGGLKDATRIALSNPDIWADIFLSNSKEVLKSINAFETSLKTLKKAVAGQDKKELVCFLRQAKDKRRLIPSRS
ncbi:MAG: prephenate dehydrogenase/arogenate dehydrogenase family protein [Candidatus Omnitrophota bacterium]